MGFKYRALFRKFKFSAFKRRRKWLVIVSPALAIPLFFAYLGDRYSDDFYFAIAGVSLILTLLVVISYFGPRATVVRPQRKKRKSLYISNLFFSNLFKLFDKIPVYRKKRRLVFGEKAISQLMILALILSASTAIFTYLGVYKTGNVNPDANLLLSYYSSQTSYILNYWIYFVPAFVLIIVLVAVYVPKRFVKIDLLHHKMSLFVNSALAVIASLFIALNLSLVALYIFVAVQANVLALSIRTGPGAVGIILDRQEIVDKLRSMDSPPKIHGVEGDIDKAIVSLRIESKGNKGNFYEQRVVKDLSGFLFLSPNLQGESLVMSGDSLLITEIDKEDIEVVTPIIGKAFLKKYLAPRYIKNEPNIGIMSRQEYLKYRDDQINEQIAEVDKLVLETQRYLNGLYSDLNKAKQRIPELESLIPSSIAKRDSYDSYCRSLSYCGYYYCYDYTNYCNQEKEEWNVYIAGLQTELEEWRVYEGQVRQAIGVQEENKAILVQYRDLVASQKDMTPQELGFFEPESTIKVVLESTSTESLADYFATVVHEYLHYTSYVSEERTLPLFFEEGLTEYYARKTIGSELESETNLGYPLLVKIIDRMKSKIPDEELEDIYFNKDAKRLKAILNNVYGKNFYEDSEFYFTAMSYVPARDALKFANNIMFKIGAEELKEEDLESTYTKFK